MDTSLVEQALGGGDTSGALDPLQIGEVLGRLIDPRAVAVEAPKVVAEWAKVALGLSDIEVPERDAQYGDPLWRQHPAFRRLAQGHLAWTQAVERMAEEDGAAWQDRERARYVTNILTGALSPANFLPTNPTAIKRAIDTGGLSLLRGARNFVHDVATNRGMPAMTDSSPFTVGENLACSPGAVVYREEMFELLQYSPTTENVRERPLLVVPPQVGRHYILDLSPGRSLVEFAIASGVQTFTLVWRNPSTDPDCGHGNWGLEDYMSAVIRAFDVVKEITGAEDLNLLGFCAGGFTSALAQAHLAAKGSRPIHAATYLVTMLDTRQPNMVTTLTTPGVDTALTRSADRSTVIDAKTIAHNFNWMRPKDLVYGYAINNWLLGEAPSAYDLLAWNDDAANISAAYVRDSTALMASGDLVTPGGTTLLGTQIDLSAVESDNFIVAAQTDHITTWRPCYMTSQLLGGDSEMVVVNKGHIQTIVSPIEKSRQKYWAGPPTGPDPDQWREQAGQHSGSWWPHWAEWLIPRSGAEQVAPDRLGSIKYPARESAPGQYVHEK
ncbi:PHA/PHB synthase family protein [Rhodococcus daqingensis]|uniref:PHA/PHB synthase family protein n=1 Tax=Rhodococcus daqingensis TaxID=2479363 RepID=A0ABW2RSP4_9NOCA